MAFAFTSGETGAPYTEPPTPAGNRSPPDPAKFQGVGEGEVEPIRTRWEIRQKDVIAASGSINGDRDVLIAATQAALAAGTPIAPIDLRSGTAN